MDKEMQAKVDEILKAHGRRELNPDDLDKVGGGLDLTRENAEQIGAMLDVICEQLGIYSAIIYANDNILKTSDWEKYMRASAGSHPGMYAVNMIVSKGSTDLNPLW